MERLKTPLDNKLVHLSTKDCKTLNSPCLSNLPTRHRYCSTLALQSRNGLFLPAFKCIFVFFVAAFFVLTGAVDAQAQETCPHTPNDPPIERDVLVLLYCSTDGPNWTNKTNWLTSSLLDDWHGVTVSNNQVEGLVLHNNGLTGQIPTELGQLTNLVLLDFSSNQLSGAIPTELGQLTSLADLDFRKNQLSGMIPTELGQLTNLVLLDFSSNQLSGMIPTELESLSLLEFLVLRDNQLSGMIPTELGQLTNLVLLDFSSNQLSGAIPTELGQLTSLADLDFRKNQLSGTIPTELGQLTSLTSLYLHNNQLSGEIPTELGQLTSLTSLYTPSNQLSGEIPNELGQLTSLVNLDFSSNQLSGEIPNELGQLTNLVFLHLHENQLSGEIPNELGQLTNLVWLYLHENQLSGEIPTELGNLSDFSLKRLYLHRNQLSGTIPTELESLSLLEFLILSNNQLSGEIPTELGQLTNLVFLFLSNNQLSGEMPTELGQLTNLEYPYLHNNQLSGEIPTELGQLTSLVNLYLHNNQLSGEIPTELGQLTSLVNLYLHNNQLSGAIPTELRQLTNLQSLTLRDNQLSGEIPTELGQLTNLQSLTLSNNQLSGEIPTELGQLTYLRDLYLHNNQLSGEIPALTSMALGNLWEITFWGNELTYTETDELGKRMDRAALRQFFNATGGTDWKNNKNWLSTEDLFLFSFSDWHGISINSDGRVSELELCNNNLDGEIGNELEALSGLETLNLSDNTSLGGTLPLSLVNLSNLGKLNIRRTGINTPTDANFQAWLGSIDLSDRGACFTPPPPPPPPPTDSSAGTVSVVKDDEGEDVAVAISPKNGGSVSLSNGETIELTIDRTEAPSQSGDPAIILPLEVLEEISKISFKIYNASPKVPPSGFRLAGLVVEIKIDYELGAGETATVCLPAAGVEEDAEIFHYNEETGMWESLESWLETVNGTPSVCAETDSFSFFGVFAAESDAGPVIPDPELDTGYEGELDAGQAGCSISSDVEAGGASQRALFNLLFIMSVLLAVSFRGPSGARRT